MVGQLRVERKWEPVEVPMDWGFAEAIAFGSLVTGWRKCAPERAGFGTRNFFASSRADV
jgi:hypothetical protein